MSYGCYLGLRLMLQRLWKNRKKSSTNRSEKKQITPHLKNQKLILLPSQPPKKLLALPDEMIASILKYSKYETVIRLRWLNARIDNVTVGYGISKPKITYLSIQPIVFHYKYRKVDMFEAPATDREYVRRSFRCPHKNRCSMLEKKLKTATRGLRTVKLNDIRINEYWLHWIDSIQEKHKVNITLNGYHLDAALDEVKKVFKKFKSAEIKILLANAMSSAYDITDKLICSLMSFACVSVLYKSSYYWFLSITDETLKELQRILPNKFLIGNYRTDFTIPEVIRTIKRRYALNPSGPFRWALGIVKAKAMKEMLDAAELIRSISAEIRIEEHSTHIDVNATGCTVRIALD